MENKRHQVRDWTALSDVWRNTLSRIPTLYGRLIYLATLREADTGRYRHHGLAAVFGRNESNAALRDSHMEVFLEWLSLPLSERHTDLDRYLESLSESRHQMVRTWRRSFAYRNLVPAAANEAERKLFQIDIETLLKLQRTEAEPIPPGSSPPE